MEEFSEEMVNISVQAHDITHDLSFTGEDLAKVKGDFQATTTNWVWYGVTIFNIFVVNSLVLFILKLKARNAFFRKKHLKLMVRIKS